MISIRGAVGPPTTHFPQPKVGPGLFCLFGEWYFFGGGVFWGINVTPLPPLSTPSQTVCKQYGLLSGNIFVSLHQNATIAMPANTKPTLYVPRRGPVPPCATNVNADTKKKTEGHRYSTMSATIII